MKRIITATIITLFCACLTAEAQYYEKKVREQKSFLKTLEFEPSVAFTVPMFNGEGMYRDWAIASLAVELRKNFSDIPMDAGIELAISANLHRWHEPEKQPGLLQHGLGLRTMSICAVADYNYYENKTLQLFAGGGIGIGQRIQSYPGFIPYGDVPVIGLCVNPRAGIELWDFLRLTTELRLTSKLFCSYSLRLGISFGGWQRGKKIKEREAYYNTPVMPDDWFIE